MSKKNIQLFNFARNTVKHFIKRLILPNIVTLAQYLGLSFYDVPACCAYCGWAKLHSHGFYYRKPNRGFLFNPAFGRIPVKRFRCTKCKKTFGVLPQCMPPFRWFLWDVQEAVLKIFISNQYTWKEISLKTGVSITTCKRWISSAQNDFALHYNTLHNVPGLIALTKANTFNLFWNKCLTQISFQSTMLLLYKLDVAIP